MQLGDVPAHTVREIERTARQFLRQHFAEEIEIPVDVDLLLERIDGVDLDYFPSLRGEHGVEGMVARNPESGQLIIYVDESLADTLPTRYRMTVAEELSHLVLHRQVIEQVTSLDQFQALQNHDLWFKLERNAKRLAAGILMPAANVSEMAKTTYPQLVKVAGYDNIEAVRKQLAISLAKKFQVSTATMVYRLGEWPVQVLDRLHRAMLDKLDFLP